jgi:hypothetical protein
MNRSRASIESWYEEGPQIGFMIVDRDDSNHVLEVVIAVASAEKSFNPREFRNCLNPEEKSHAH